MEPGSFFAGLSALRGIWNKLKGTPKIQKIDAKLFSNNKLRKNFLKKNKNAIFLQFNGDIKGDVYLGDLTKMPDEKKEELKESFDGNEEKNEIDIVDTDFYFRVKKWKNDYGDFSKIEKYLPCLDEDVGSILKLSTYAEKLFQKKDIGEAESVRNDIGYKYKKWGRKLSNLYLSGYVNGVLEYLLLTCDGDAKEMRSRINKEIIYFVNHSENIYFVYEGVSVDETTSSIKAKIDLSKPYIAVHAAGRNIEISKDIMNGVREYALDADYKVEEEKKKGVSGVNLFYSYFIKKKKDDKAPPKIELPDLHERSD